MILNQGYLKPVGCVFGCQICRNFVELLVTNFKKINYDLIDEIIKIYVFRIKSKRLIVYYLADIIANS